MIQVYTILALGNSVPIWWWLTQANCPVISVAISGEGGYVAIGTWNFTYNDGNLHYFANSRGRAGLQPSFTWQSVGIGDPVYRGTFDMSDNGDYIALGGSGNSLYYFINCRTRSGSSQASTWNFLSGGFVEIVDLSSDGRYVAFGGSTPDFGGFVAFCKDAFSLPYPTAPLWSKNVLNPVWEVTVSDDGFAVAAVTGSSDSLYYWNDAKSLSGNPAADWEYAVPLTGGRFRL